MNARELEVTLREVRWSLTVLLLAFVFCKLAGVTDIAAWSWVWVLVPLWLPVGAALSAWLVDLAVIRYDRWALRRAAAKRAAQARQDHTGGQVEASRFTRRPNPDRVTVSDLIGVQPVDRAVRSLGGTLLYLPEYLRYDIRHPDLLQPVRIEQDDLTRAVDPAAYAVMRLEAALEADRP